jgi:hypothetical protein
LGFTTDGAGSFVLRTKESTNMDSPFVDLHDLLTGDIVEDFGLLGAEYGFESESAGGGHVSGKRAFPARVQEPYAVPAR